MTMPAVVDPVVKFTFDAVGRATPVGYSVRYPEPAGVTAVTFSTTAATPVAGTPARPRTVTAVVDPAPGMVVVRVSSRRVGDSGV